MAGHKEDNRFDNILSDPKLQQIKMKEQRSKVDKRFQSLIASSKSKQKCLIDKRGRPVTALSKGGLSRFYDLSDSEEEEDSTQKAIHSKSKKENDILKKKDKKKKQEKTKIVKDEKKERNILINKSDSEEDDDKLTDEEQEIEMDVAQDEDEKDEDETEEDEDDGESDDNDDSDSEIDSDDDDDMNSSKRHKKKKDDMTTDYSRGIGNISSSSDDEEDDVDQDCDSGDDIRAKGPVAAIHPWAEMMEKEVPVVEQSTRRLAVCNMNWDYVTAQDLMMLCNSFKPQHGTVFSVTIYPTEFGIERMREEHKKGPKEIVQDKQNTTKSTTQTMTTEAETEEIESTNAGPSKSKTNKVSKEKQSTEKKNGKNSEIVRKYELNRLRYFFAVVECDSVETSDLIYSNCDGMEFEKSGTKLDFRYIPDSETFDYEPKSVATSLPASGTYKPPHFVDAAVSRTDVKLSWDRTSHQRLAVTQMDFRKVKNIDELEDQFQEYIAPYTSEEDDDDEEGEDPYPDLDWSYIPGELPAKKDVQEMKSALLEVKEEEKAEEEEAEEEEHKSDDDQVHMEFSWDIGLKDTLEGAAKQKKKEAENAQLTPWEQYQKNRKDKKRQKEREKKRKGKSEQKKESTKTTETSVELDNFFLPDGSSDEEKEKPKRQKESLKKRAKKRKREAEEQRLEVDQSVLADPRFADLTKKDFALDPSAPEFRKRRRKF